MFMQPSGLHRLCLESDNLNWKKITYMDCEGHQNITSAEKISVLHVICCRKKLIPSEEVNCSGPFSICACMQLWSAKE